LTGINEAGDIVGFGSQGFFLKNSQRQSLTFGSNLVEPFGVNSTDEIVANTPVPILIQGGNVQRLPLGRAMAINDLGQVIGASLPTNGNLVERAALWDQGQTIDPKSGS
jgi:probable HAF family extracellular repeat protein